MPYGIDRRIRSDVVSEMNYCSNHCDKRAKEQHESAKADTETEQSVVKKRFVEAIRRQIFRKTFRVCDISGGSSVHCIIAKLNLPPTVYHRRVRVLIGVGVRVMLSVNGDPLSWSNSGGKPKHETEGPTRQTAKGEGPM